MLAVTALAAAGITAVSAWPNKFVMAEKTNQFKQVPISMVFLDNDPNRCLILEKSGKVSICKPNTAGFPCEKYMRVRRTLNIHQSAI
jgi:hypothetical protein